MAILGMSKIWITVGPIIVINVLLFVSLAIYALTGHAARRDIHEAAHRSSSRWLSVYLREWWVWTTDPVARMFVRMHMGPNIISMLGFLLAVVAGVLFAKGSFGYAGWAMIFGATFDIFDGRVARLSNKVTRSGGYFDAIMDRFGEGVCFLGLGIYFHAHWLLPFIIAGLVGSMMVSYTKAKAESVGIACKVGSMQRPERIVYMGVSSVFTPLLAVVLAPWWPSSPPILVYGALVVVAVATNGTAIYRMIHTMNALDTADRRETESIPQLITRLSTVEGRTALWEKTRYGYDRSRAQYAHVTLFLIDSLVPERLDELMRRGALPNIARHIAERGTVTTAVSTFPSVTGPSFTPFVTGCFPGSCDIPGVRWFDRTVPEGRLLTMNRFRDYLGWGAYAMDHDLAMTTRTIFEYSRRAVNIFGMPSRGCGLMRDPAFFKLYSMFRRAGRGKDLDTIFETARLWFAEAMRRDADFVLYALPAAADGDAGSDEAVYRRIDEAVGHAAEELKAKGLYEQAVVLLACGNARAPIESSFDLTSFLSDRYKLFSYPGKPREWLEAEAITAASGSAMMNVYFRNEGSWQETSFFEALEQRGLIGALIEKRGIDVLAGRSVEGGVVMASRRGRAHAMEDPDGRVTYITKGGDPFGYAAMPQVMRMHDALTRTYDTDYPDALVQVLQLFRSARAGDLVISAEASCDISGVREEGDVPSNGGALHRRHSVVPLMSSVPLAAAPLRTVDVGAMVMRYLGIEAEHHLDGVARGRGMSTAGAAQAQHG